MTIKTIDLTLSLQDGTTRVIPARKVTEHFAIHRDLLCPDYYTVTHIPSGLYATWGYTRTGAMRVARKMESLPVEWDNIRLTKDARDLLPREQYDSLVILIHDEHERSGVTK